MTTKSQATALNIADIERAIDMDGDGVIDPDEKEILDLLRKMDVDGDGTIGLRELVNLGNQMNQASKEANRMRKLIYGVFFLSILFCGVMFCVSMAAVEAAKDSKPSPDGTLETVPDVDGNTKLVAVNTASTAVPITEIYTLDLASLKAVNEVSYQLGQIFYSYTVNGFVQEITGDAITVTLQLFGGDQIISSADTTELIKASNNQVIDLAEAERKRLHRHRQLLAEGRTLLQAGGFGAGITVNGKRAEVESDTEALMEAFMNTEPFEFYPETY